MASKFHIAGNLTYLEVTTTNEKVDCDLLSLHGVKEGVIDEIQFAMRTALYRDLQTTLDPFNTGIVSIGHSHIRKCKNISHTFMVGSTAATAERGRSKRSRRT